MVVVLVQRSKGAVRGFRISGHAGFADKGKDIVCAAVSALAQAAALGIQQVAGLEAAVRIQDGDLACSLGDNPAEKETIGQAILETMLLGLREIAAEYPGTVRVDE